MTQATIMLFVIHVPLYRFIHTMNLGARSSVVTTLQVTTNTDEQTPLDSYNFRNVEGRLKEEP